MKNLRIIIVFALLCLLTTNINAQLPLQYGDAVVTHSQFNSNSPNNPVVVRTIRTSNTSNAPLGSNWAYPSLKPQNYNDPQWTFDILGAVFGITLDTRPYTNIYVSNSAVHSAAPANGSKVWRLDGVSGIPSLVFDFNNNNRSLGNIKYKEIGGIENIYVSNFENGAIERLTGNSNTTNVWARQTSFTPKFGELNTNANFLPYGLALRKMPNNTYKLYYAKINIAPPYGTFEIWSVDLNSNGDFVSSSEQPQFIETTSFHSITSVQANTGIVYRWTVISDMTFSEDGESLLIGQQSWSDLFKLAPHSSNVVQLKSDGINSWSSSPNLFPSGNLGSNTSNCTGGVSYSNNILQTDTSQYGCDTTVAFSTDAINLSNPSVYGVQLMNNGPSNSISNSIWIDQDDYYGSQDKSQLGDIEVYKNPQVCKVACECGTWENIQFGKDEKWWVNTKDEMPPLPVLSFEQGQVHEILFPKYNCNGSCDATFSYSIENPDGKVQPLKGGNGLDLGKFNKLSCGSYFINITPTCDGVECPPVQIPLVIVCPPQCIDCGGNAKVNMGQEFSYKEKDGVLVSNFSISNENPVTEVRVLVEEFRISSENGNENCILCNNTPKTWGSIQHASLAGLTNRPSDNESINNRETIFSNDEILDLNSSEELRLILAMPELTDLECCTLKGELCIKVIIRDVFCCEQEILKCFTFDLK